MGHAALKSAWQPTLSLLLQSRKPIVCTALSRFDLLRDIAFIEQVAAEEDYQELGQPLDVSTYYNFAYIYYNFTIRINIIAPDQILIQPELNPFRTGKRVFDDQEENEQAKVVTANEFIFAFQAK